MRALPTAAHTLSAARSSAPTPRTQAHEKLKPVFDMASANSAEPLAAPLPVPCDLILLVKEQQLSGSTFRREFKPQPPKAKMRGAAAASEPEGGQGGAHEGADASGSAAAAAAAADVSMCEPSGAGAAAARTVEPPEVVSYMAPAAADSKEES